MSASQYVEQAQFREVLERLDQRIDNRVNRLEQNLGLVFYERVDYLTEHVTDLQRIVHHLDDKMKLVLKTYGLDS